MSKSERRFKWKKPFIRLFSCSSGTKKHQVLEQPEMLACRYPSQHERAEASSLQAKNGSALSENASEACDRSTLLRLVQGDSVCHRFLHVRKEEKNCRIVDELAKELSIKKNNLLSKGRDPSAAHNGRTLVFVREAYKADHLTGLLIARGVNAVSLHTYRSPELFDDALEQFSDDCYVMLATDCLRTSDPPRLPLLEHIINVDLPSDSFIFRERVSFLMSGQMTTFVDPRLDSQVVYKDFYEMVRSAGHKIDEVSDDLCSHLGIDKRPK
ncbi:hypothetical protein QR680_004389 [Steinernema hermaphroditum]|uniref:Helicase C-terminal domain-containing protein n=1 Tax=Steinernema hermaphroditum TaxID=289476 RepID=A0AA39HQS4_9BILA|nr:hypothetical protein QR680_004389 [Steinernema hermaphroditum]